MTIDPQYTVGFTLARQYGLRLAKNFDNKAWLAVSVEDAQATISTHGNADNFLLGSAGAVAVSTMLVPARSPQVPLPTWLTTPSIHRPMSSPNSSLNRASDTMKCSASTAVSVTACFPALRILPVSLAEVLTAASAVQAYNSSKNGGGIGANARWSFDNKHVDFGLHFFGGDGVGRYGTGGLADASIKADGIFNLIHSYQAWLPSSGIRQRWMST